MKKILSLLLAVVMLFGCCAMFASCGGNKYDVKVGLICLHDENSTYDKNFIDAMYRTIEALGMKESQVIIKTNIDENSECLDAAEALVEEGCDVIFANSFGHEPYIIEAAEKYPDVEFCHATGTKAHTENLANYHNAFASIYEGRFLAGVVAGLKLIDMGKTGDVKVGYVGAHPYAEVISGYTSWFLGVRYAVKTYGNNAMNVTMTVKYTGSWYDPDLERSAAEALIDEGCVLISQHADSMGAPNACEAANVPNVSYNGSTATACPNTFLVSSYIDWDPYYQLMIKKVAAGEAIPTDYCGGFAEGSVKLTDLNPKTGVVPAGTADKIADVKAKLIDGTLKVFDTTTFTKDGNAVDSYLADVDDMGDWKGETEVVKGGQFEESKYRSAPYFDIIIDGITVPAN